MNTTHPPQQEQQQQYAFELNEHDVLCGRGSGPNDRVGNIEFRNLVFSRKAEYLAAPSRDAKGRIATSIVDTVRARGGRFLKKLSVAVAKEKGFKRGMMVYELADEPTVLEKAKQTLRQNRGEFLKEHSKDGGAGSDADGGGMINPPIVSAGAVTSGPVRRTSVDEGVILYNGGIIPTTLSAHNQNGNTIGPSTAPTSSIQGSLNPIPLGEASVGLDSMQRPNLSARTAEHLNQVLFSSNISSVTNPSLNGNMMSMNSQQQQGQQMGLNNTAPGSSGNYSIMSMNTAELCAAMGGSNNTFVNSQNSGMTGTSAQAFGSLLREYNTEEEKTLLVQQYEQLKAQQELLLQQQQALPQNQMPQNNYQQLNNNTMGYIPKGQEQQFQQQFVQPAQGQQHNASDVFSSLMRQYNNNPEGVYSNGDDQGGAQQHVQQGEQFRGKQFDQLQAIGAQQGQQYEQQQQVLSPSPLGMRNQQQPHDVPSNIHAAEKTALNDGANCDSFVRRLSTDDQQMLLQQFQQLQSQQMGGSYSSEQPTQQQQPTTQQQQQIYKEEPPVQQEQPTTHLQTLKNIMGSYNESQTSLNESKQAIQMGSQYVDSYATLNDSQQKTDSFSKSYDSQQTLQSGSATRSYRDSSEPLKQPIKDAEHSLHLLTSYMDSSKPLAPIKDYQPNAKKPLAGGVVDLTEDTFQFDPSRRRCSRRRSSRTNSSTKSNESGLRLSNVEPADFTDESLRLSFLTAQRLNKTLGDDMSMTSFGASGNWAGNSLKTSATSKGASNRASYMSQLDSSMLSLMSMSLSEMPLDGSILLKDPSTNNTRHNDSDENNGGNKSRTLRDLEVAVEKEEEDEDMRFGESVMSLGASLDDKEWNKYDD